MKPVERLNRHVTVRAGLFVIAAVVVLALSSTSGRRLGLTVLAATAVVVPSAIVRLTPATRSIVAPAVFAAMFAFVFCSRC